MQEPAPVDVVKGVQGAGALIWEKLPNIGAAVDGVDNPSPPESLISVGMEGTCRSN
jgi:hypothetical protein